MNLFTTNAPRVLAAASLALALATPASAQEDLAAPSGWAKSMSGGDVVFSQPSSGCRFVVKKLSPLNGSLRSWFDAATARDSSTRGQLISPGEVKRTEGRLTLVRKFRSSRGPQSVAYLGYSVADRGRLVVSSGPSDQVLAGALREMSGMARQLGAIDGTTRRGATSSAGTRRSATERSASREARDKQRALRGGIATGAGKGLKSAQVLGVYLAESYGSGVGGMVITTFDGILLLRDGSARRYLEISPADLDVARDKAANARDWGRWTRGGKGFVVRWPRDSRGREDKDELKASFKTKPARPGQTMARAYQTIGGGGNTALGGNVMVAFSNSYQFARNGTFTTDGGGGASVGATDTMGGVATSSRRRNAGRYKLDGHTITLRYNDGRVVRKMFYFFPDSDRAIAIGDTTFTIDD